MNALLIKTISGRVSRCAAIGASLVIATASEAGKVFTVTGSVRIQAETGQLAPARAEVVEQGSFASKKGVALKDGVAANVGAPDTEPDLVFRVRSSQPGRYVMRTHAATDARGTELMARTRSKHGSLRLMIAVGEGRPTQRVVFVPWSRPESCRQTTGKFNLDGNEQSIRIWLPEGVRLDSLELGPYTPPRVPAAAENYEPTVVPPPSRPRIWVNAESLPRVRANLTQGENAPIWAQVQALAAKPFAFDFEPNTEVGYNAALENAAVTKAFVYLMTGQTDYGREAVALIRDYLAVVEFGNLLDITREIGRAIYSGAQVYDWCYELVSPDDREAIRSNLMRLADDMEIGWPPFRQMVVNGHGAEAQVFRDLLCLGIAVYDEDPVPYRYCAYRILEELVPMRAFEYQSPRHNQGASYGPSRFRWEMHAALLFDRMTGKPVFDDNIKEVCHSWFYMRLPNGETLRDGDGFADGRPATLGATALLCAAYANDPIVKGDFERQGGLRSEPLLVLLLNDPALEAVRGFDSLPLSKDFGPILGSMIARTGWNMGGNLSDVVVEMKGGGYNFGNHQHSDAGSFQIYYRGLQAADLGQYHFYGTPYDSNFCKRSISHSMMLAVDPDEKFHRNSSNDGGTRFVRSCPLTPEQAQTDPLFANGTVVSADFGPSRQRPFYSYFSVDLTSAYSEKIDNYVRSFCFLNLDSTRTPATLIVLDNMTTAKAEFRKYWQVNTLKPPEGTAEGVILRNSDLGLSGKVEVRMLRPKPADRTVQILSGKEANSVFGQYFTPPRPDRPEANGHRVLFSPATEQTNDVFLTVLSMADEDAAAPPLDVTELPDAFVLTLPGRVVVMSKTGQLLATPLAVDVQAEGECQLLVSGLAPGVWSIRSEDEQVGFNTRVEAGRNTAFFVLPGGRYTVRPEPIPGATEFRAAPDVMPAPAPKLANRVLIGGGVASVPPTKMLGDELLLPAAELARIFGLTVSDIEGALHIRTGSRTAVFRNGADTFELNGHPFRMPVAAMHEDGVWLVSDSILAPLFDRFLIRDQEGNCVESAPMRIPHRDDILWIEANDVNDPIELHAMLADIPGRTAYWAAHGQGVQVDLTLARPVRLGGVGIAWHQGSGRKARFALDTRTDGTTWNTVFDGASSGTSATMERYSFPPHEVRQIRFRGFGNTVNNWNSIVHFRVLPAE